MLFLIVFLPNNNSKSKFTSTGTSSLTYKAKHYSIETVRFDVRPLDMHLISTFSYLSCNLISRCFILITVFLTNKTT